MGTGIGDVVGWGACIFVAGCLGMALVDRLRRGRSGSGARSQSGAAPIDVAIVDVGTPPHRVVDLRRVSWDALATRAFTEGLAGLFAGRAAPVGVVWVFGSSLASVLPELTDTVHVLLWPRYVALAPRATHALYVDAADPPTIPGLGAIEAAGMSVALRPPTFVVATASAVGALTLDEVLEGGAS